MVLDVASSFNGRFDHMGRCREVGLTCTEPDDGLAGGLQRFSPGIDRKGRRFGDGGDTAREALCGHWGSPWID